ncbi:hypothetical protein OSB04_001426 [Centaurea solstitialis]|uniref:Phorbol-ester/DAG-type domain-containing protein n=1 Tax=Centaurea solstitialis TaxID=347529 RepID=A0AA38WSN7_9ASTR|nr:hypothetical protein OSB04_001426 [Centaurea solstitialis]
MDYKHFSHPHNLTIHRVHELGQQVNCAGCHSACDNATTAVHACHRCSFFLHDHCANAGRCLRHPSHKPHPLILLPYPTYAGGSFVCNACGHPGKSFSYCCTPCEFDLHVGCAFMPLSVTHVAHQHELGLFYGVPVVPRRGSNTDLEYCGICRKVLEERHWAYCCQACDFNVHTACATTEVVPGLYNQDDSQAADGGGGGGGNVVEVELTEEELIRLYNIKLQMQLAEQLAQSMASLSTRG